METPHEEDRLPQDFGNLNELNAPPPIKNPEDLNTYKSTTLEATRSRSPRNVSGERWRRMSHGSLEQNQSSNSRHRSQGQDADLSELAAPPPIDNPVNEEMSSSTVSPPRPRTHQSLSQFVTKLHTISYLIFFSIFGTLARLGLQALTTYPGAPITTGVVWANVGGSLVMGFLLEDRRLFSEHRRSMGSKDAGKGGTNGASKGEDAEARKKEHMTLKKTIPLYIGLATGFCGSFTSFSSFIRDVFLALSNSAPVTTGTPIPERSGGYSFLALLASLIITPSLSLAALQFGAHLALASEQFLPALSFAFTRTFLDRSIVPLAFLSWLAAVIMSIFPPDRPSGTMPHSSWSQETWRTDALFALVFAPLGCLTRFYASLYLNNRIPSFPLGTFVVNIVGTILLGMFYDLQHAPLAVSQAIGGGRVGCQVLQGLMDGFCGCLTTVSTWVAELKGLRQRHAYIYGGSSLGVGIACLLIIMGSLRWTRGFGDIACGTA